MRSGVGLRATGCGVVLALALGACGRGGDDRDEERVVVQHVPVPGAIAPLWQLELPRDPNLPVVRSIAGPAVGDGIAVVGATGIGWAGVDLAAGELAWHVPGEGRPATVRAHRGRFELRGECAHLPYARAGGCVQSVSAQTGQVTTVDWPAPATPSAERLPISIADEMLSGPDWEAEDRFHAIIDRTHDTVRAIRLTGGIGPVTLDATDGSSRSEGSRVQALQVLAYTLGADGGVGIVLRMDRTMLDDRVAYFDRDDRLVWTWPLPKPDSPRVDGVGIAGINRGVVVFYDARTVARLGVEYSNTVTP